MNIDLIIGTRPEAIKLAPVYRRLKTYPGMEPRIVFTGQHDELMKGIPSAFGISPDFQLDVMRKGQSLAALTGRLLTALDEHNQDNKPDLVLVQGDTTSAFVGGLAAYYHKIPVGHVEAGLRTEDIYAPFPEEFNRRGIGQLATVHFAPTPRAFQLLKQEGHEEVHLTGNTVVDAIQFMREKISDTPVDLPFSIPSAQKMAIVTVHRRENHGEGLKSICKALQTINATHSDLHLVLPVHLNPEVREVIHRELGNRERIHLIEALSYPEMVAALDQAHLLITDSGGLQEEAPAFGLPTVVLREKSERMEAVEQGIATLVGNDEEKIIQAVDRAFRRNTSASEMVNPFGDGLASMRIADIIAHLFKPA
ncbi:MAG: UDP-N-acetylglucosamine 2-epimerase (non-hydrolyzing) [Flavobacteriales bacterium]|nr:UDP-N-acetylglucosamine 2-epimerase (non-hydrolyzing) [Flavobacteriales bacterium]